MIHPLINLALARGGYVTFPTVPIKFKGRREHDIRQQLLDDKGCTCARCTKTVDFYNTDLHHTNPNKKKFTLDQKTIGAILDGEGMVQGMKKILAETAKTILLCRTCHKAVHANPRKELAYFDPDYRPRFGAWLPRWESQVTYPAEIAPCKQKPCRWHITA